MNVHFWIDKYVAQGALKPLDPYFEKDKFDQSVYYPASNGHQRMMGKNFGIGFEYGGGCVRYNKDLFDQMGVPYPPKDGNWTWDDFREIARKLTKRNPDGSFVSFGLEDIGVIYLQALWADSSYSNGARVIDEIDYTKCLLDQDLARQHIKYFRDMKAVERLAPWAEESQALQNAFLSGKCGMSWAFPGTVAGLGDAKFKWDIVEVPFSPYTKQRLTTDMSNFYTMMANVHQPDAAWRLMKYLGNGDGPDSPQAQLCRDAGSVVPHIKANETYWATKFTGINRDRVLRSMRYTWRYPHCPAWYDIHVATGEELSKMWTGTSVDDAIKAVVTRVNATLKQTPTPKGWAELWTEEPDKMA